MKRFLSILMLMAICLSANYAMEDDGGYYPYYYSPRPAKPKKPKAQAKTYKYEGTLGSKSVTLSLTQSGTDTKDRHGTLKFVKGTFSVDDGAAKDISGYDWTVSKSALLQEFSDSGNTTATWDLNGYIGDDELKGLYIDPSNGKTENITLKKIS